jgi:Mg-chelatase subunit ChlD
MGFALLVSFDQDIVSPVSTLSRAGRDVLVNLDENATVFSVLDQNLSAGEQMDLLEKEIVSLLPPNTHYRLELERFVFDSNACPQYQSYSTCFSSPFLFPAKGEDIPENRNVAVEQKIFFRKGTQTFCSIGETGELEFKQPACFSVPLTALFSENDSSERIAWLDAASDANIAFSASVTPSGVVDCDEPIRVDLNVTALSGGRPPVDVMLVMDRSGSMSWGGWADANDSRSLLLDQNTVFVADGSWGLVDINVSSPGLPTISGKLRGLGTATGVAVKDNYAFIASTGSEQILDVDISSSRDSNVNVGYNAAQSWAGQSFITNNAVIQGVRLNLRRTGNPSDLNVHLRATIDGPDIASVSYPAGSIGTSYGWRAINFPQPVLLDAGNMYVVVLTTPSQSTSNYYRWGYHSTDVYSFGQAYRQTTPLSGDLLMQTYISPGLEVINISDRSAPFLAGTYALADAQKVTVQEDYLYLSDGSYGLKIFDISNPRSPVLLGSRDTTDADGLFVSGNYAYVADHGSGLRIIDITNKSNPLISSTYNTPGTAYAVRVENDIAYVADGSSLQIINVSNKSAPSYVNWYNTPGTAYDVWIDNGSAYVADNSSLQVIDVSIPTNPVFVKSFATPYSYQGIVIRNNWAFLAAGNQGLITIDLSLGPRIDQAKASGSRFLDYNLWKTQDQLGLSSFSTSANLNQGLTNNCQDVNNALYALVANGSTNIAAGIRNATTELTTSPRQNPDAYKFEVLLSDGQSNTGDNPLIAAQEAHDQNIVIFTIAFGMDADQETLESIANLTDGNFYFAEDENALSRLYLLIAQEIGEIASASQVQIIQDANLLVPIPEGARILDFDGGSPLQIGNQDYVYYFIGDYFIGDLNGLRQHWSGYFILTFDCNSNFSCADTNRFLPPDGTFFEWKDRNGVSQPAVAWDSNAQIFLHYRDLTVRVLKAEAGANSNVLLDINAINSGYLDTDDRPIPVEIRLENPLSEPPLASYTVEVPPRFYGEKDSDYIPVGNDRFAEWFSMDSGQEEDLYVVINPYRTVPECFNNNVVRVYCSSAESDYLVLRLWVWK